MTPEQIQQITQQVLQSVLTVAGNVEPQSADPAFNENVQKASAERQRKVEEKAAEYADGLSSAFSDFGMFIQGRMLSQLARSARDGYFFSRRLAEFQQTKVDGLRDKRMASGLEIDPLSDAEEMLQTHLRNMEENEVLLAALRQAWIQLDRVAAQQLSEREQESFAKLVPDFDIGEGAYTAFDSKKNREYQHQQQKNREGSIMAARTLAKTESHGFI